MWRNEKGRKREQASERCGKEQRGKEQRGKDAWSGWQIAQTDDKRKVDRR
jgi:hypothetical protein